MSEIHKIICDVCFREENLTAPHHLKPSEWREQKINKLDAWKTLCPNCHELYKKHCDTFFDKLNEKEI